MSRLAGNISKNNGIGKVSSANVETQSFIGLRVSGATSAKNAEAGFP